MKFDANTGQSLANLDAYLDTWTDDSGGLHGYVIHHHRDYTVLISPATWPQSVRILAHLDLWSRTRDEKWLEKAVKGSEYLVSAYVWEEHIFHDSTTPLPLVNNAWPCLALFRTATALRRLGDDRWSMFAETAKDCMENRIIRLHWDADGKDFYFCPVGFPSERVHTYNQTAVTISALCALAELEGNEEILSEYAIPAADHLVRDQVKEKESDLLGGWGYNDGASGHLFYYLYTALNCRGLIDIYEHTKEPRYLESARLAGKHLVEMIDPQTKLFSHRYVRKGGTVKKYTYPTMIATSGLGLVQLRRLNRLGSRFDMDTSIQTLLDKQQPHGGFPSFIGSTDIWTPELYPCEPEKIKWRDILCVPFWACFTLELLADLLPENAKVPPADVKNPLTTRTDDGYEVQEDENRVRLRKQDRTVTYFVKKDDYMLFSTEPMRGVPFGAFANAAQAGLEKLRRKLKIGAVLGGAILLIETALIVYLLLF